MKTIAGTLVLICLAAIAGFGASTLHAEDLWSGDEQEKDAQVFLKNLGEKFVLPQLKTFEALRPKRLRDHTQTGVYAREQLPFTLTKDDIKDGRRTYWLDGYTPATEKKGAAFSYSRIYYSPRFGFKSLKAKHPIKEVSDFASYFDGEAWMRAMPLKLEKTKRADHLRTFAAFLAINGYRWQLNRVLTLLANESEAYKQKVSDYFFAQDRDYWTDDAVISFGWVGGQEREDKKPQLSGWYVAFPVRGELKAENIKAGKSIALAAWEEEAKLEIDNVMQRYRLLRTFITTFTWNHISADEKSKLRKQRAFIPTLHQLDEEISRAIQVAGHSSALNEMQKEYEKRKKKSPKKRRERKGVFFLSEKTYMPRSSNLFVIHEGIKKCIEATAETLKKAEAFYIKGSDRSIGGAERMQYMRKAIGQMMVLFPKYENHHIPEKDCPRGKKNPLPLGAANPWFYRRLYNYLYPASEPNHRNMRVGLKSEGEAAEAVINAHLDYYPNDINGIFYKAQVLMALEDNRSDAIELFRKVIASNQERKKAIKKGSKETSNLASEKQAAMARDYQVIMAKER